MLFEGFIIIDAYLMLDGTGASQLIGLEHKDVMIRKEQLPHGSSITGGPLTQAVKVQLIHHLLLLLLDRQSFSQHICTLNSLFFRWQLHWRYQHSLHHMCYVHTLLEKDGTVSHVLHHN